MYVTSSVHMLPCFNHQFYTLSPWLQSPVLYTLLTGFNHQDCILFSLTSVTNSVYSSHWLQSPVLYTLLTGFNHQDRTYFLGSATRAVPTRQDSVTRSVLILRGFSQCFEDVRYKKNNNMKAKHITQNRETLRLEGMY